MDRYWKSEGEDGVLVAGDLCPGLCCIVDVDDVDVVDDVDDVDVDDVDVDDVDDVVDVDVVDACCVALLKFIRLLPVWCCHLTPGSEFVFRFVVWFSLSSF